MTDLRLFFFKGSYVQRFGPTDRPTPAARWGVTAFRPIQIVMNILRPAGKEMRMLMVGLDAAGKTTVLCKYFNHIYDRCAYSQNRNQTS
jgi:hypothetical protein